jgi:predicted ATPase/DNA-binding winged helix-turn-helix (wHTH) protein
MTAADHPPLRFGRFELSPAERVLRAEGESLPLGARAFDLLLALVERRGRVVARQELLDLVWPGVVVEEHNITAQVSSLRKVLGAQAIATVPGRGYRFVVPLDAAPVEATARNEAPLPSHNLPEQRTRFIGREAVLADLERLLAQARLLTLTGIGGCGKTRLALKLAQQLLARFPDGVWFVDLAPLCEAERVVSACAAALELDLGGSGAPPVERLAAHLCGREALIVLDNCEQVRDGAAALADAVLGRPGRSRILATSRVALAVAGEQLYPVPPLILPATADVQAVRDAEAVRVFVDRARLAQPDFDVDAGNAAAVAEICRRLDGIALAIELAAARVAMLPAGEIAARLHDRFRLLAAGGPAVAHRHTLEATMQWSCDQLEPAESHMLCVLSVFAGGWTLQAAMALAQAADECEALAQLTALHDRSLIAVDRGTGSRPRYRMLETVREYAQRRLLERGQAEAARQRHAEYFLALAEQAAPQLSGAQQSAWMAALRDEQENLVAALGWCCDERSPADPRWGLRLAAATQRYWVFNDVALGCRLVQAALRRDGDGADSAVRFDALRALAAMYMHRGRGDEGLPHARAALAMAQRLRDPQRQAMACVGIGACLGLVDEAAALDHYEQARDLAQAAGHAEPLAAALNNIANIDFWHGRLDAAERGLRQALHLSRGRGDIRGALIELHNLIRVLVDARRLDEARVCAREAGQLLQGVDEPALKLEWIEVGAGLASSCGDHDTAARLWGFATPRFAEAGYRHPPQDEAQVVRLSAASRRALGDVAFERAQAAGRAQDLEAAMRELRRSLAGGG